MMNDLCNLDVGPGKRFRFRPAQLTWLPLPLLLAAILVLRITDLPGSHESIPLMVALNLVFSVMVSALIAYLVARSFLIRTAPGLLLLGCGVILWGPAGILPGFVAANDVNIGITIHNSCVWLSALCHLAGVVLSLRPRRTLSPATFWLPVAYLAATGAVALIALSALAGWMPTFFIQGQGGTPLRQFVLLSAVAMFAFTALLLGTANRRSISGFAYWYALAMALLAIGLLGVALQSYRGGILGWTGRAAQFLGGLYMFIAAIASVRESDAWGISLEMALRQSEERAQLALRAGRMATWDRLLPDGEVVWNEEHFRMLGYAPGEVRPSYQAWSDRVHPDDLAEAAARFHGSLETGGEFTSEFRVVWPDGTIHWMEVRGRTECDAAGRPVRSYGVMLDVTERKGVEAALGESNERYRLVLDGAEAAIWDWDVPARKVMYSSRWKRMRGLADEEIGDDEEEWSRAIHPADAPRVMAAVQAHFEGRTPFFAEEYRTRRKDGSWLWIADRGLAHRDASGRVVRMAGSETDITARKQAEETLQQNERTFAELIERAPFGIYVVDARFRIAHMNANSQNGAFRNVRPVIGRDFAEAMRVLWPEEVAAQIIGVFRHTLETGEPYYSPRFINPRADVDIIESYEWELHRMMLPDGQFGVICYYYDSTKLREAEEALRASEENARRRVEELATLMDVTPTAVWVSTDPRCEVITGNRAAQGFYEAGKDENLSAGPVGGEQDFTRRFFQDGQELKPERLPMQMAAARGVEVRDCELDVLLPSGKTITILGNASPLRDAEGHVRGSVAAFVDITARKQAEQAVRENEERLRRMIEASPVAIGFGDSTGKVFGANESFYRLTGYTREELRASALGWDRLTAPEYAELDRRIMATLATTGSAGPYEKEYIRKDGSRVPLLLSASKLAGRDEHIAFIVDITERKQAEAALRELNATLEGKVAERTAALEHRTRQLQKLALELTQAEDRERRRVAAILHEDLQQQIAGAKFHLGLLNGRAGQDPKVGATVAKVAEMLKEAIEKSRSLSHELSPAVLHRNDLGESLGWLARQMRANHGLTVRTDVAGELVLHSEAVAVFLFRTAQEMLFNAIKHARGSEVRLRARRMMGRYVGLSVSDGGRGFDPQSLRETAGFGLLSIRERVELLGGRLKIRSAAGQGSALFVVVPDAPLPENGERKTAGAGLRSRPVSGNHRGSPLRVLLVDDHDIVREGLAALLAEAGDIEVVGEAPDGREAIDLAIRLRPDVVLMDVVMPLMNGDEAARQIKANLPDTRIVALSMLREEAMEKMRQAGAEAFVLKTASSAELLAAVRGAVPCVTTPPVEVPPL